MLTVPHPGHGDGLIQGSSSGADKPARCTTHTGTERRGQGGARYSFTINRIPCLRTGGMIVASLLREATNDLTGEKSDNRTQRGIWRTRKAGVVWEGAAVRRGPMRKFSARDNRTVVVLNSDGVIE